MISQLFVPHCKLEFGRISWYSSITTFSSSRVTTPICSHFFANVPSRVKLSVFGTILWFSLSARGPRVCVQGVNPACWFWRATRIITVGSRVSEVFQKLLHSFWQNLDVAGVLKIEDLVIPLIRDVQDLAGLLDALVARICRVKVRVGRGVVLG